MESGGGNITCFCISSSSTNNSRLGGGKMVLRHFGQFVELHEARRERLHREQRLDRGGVAREHRLPERLREAERVVGRAEAQARAQRRRVLPAHRRARRVRRLAVEARE